MGLQSYSSLELPLAAVYAARERAKGGDPDGALLLMREAIDEFFSRGQTPWAVPAAGVLVETLLARGTEADVGEPRRQSSDWRPR
jgi:hypothetical protein